MALALFVDALVTVTVVPVQELDLSANATTDIDCHV